MKYELINHFYKSSIRFLDEERDYIQKVISYFKNEIEPILYKELQLENEVFNWLTKNKETFNSELNSNIYNLADDYHNHFMKKIQELKKETDRIGLEMFYNGEETFYYINDVFNEDVFYLLGESEAEYINWFELEEKLIGYFSASIEFEDFYFEIEDLEDLVDNIFDNKSSLQMIFLFLLEFNDFRSLTIDDDLDELIFDKLRFWKTFYKQLKISNLEKEIKLIAKYQEKVIKVQQDVIVDFLMFSISNLEKENKINNKKKIEKLKEILEEERSKIKLKAGELNEV